MVLGGMMSVLIEVLHIADKFPQRIKKNRLILS